LEITVGARVELALPGRTGTDLVLEETGEMIAAGLGPLFCCRRPGEKVRTHNPRQQLCGGPQPRVVMAGLVPAIHAEPHMRKDVDARAFASPKRLRPRRRDKPGHDSGECVASHYGRWLWVSAFAGTTARG